jgi:CBS-domain-containing membrane protein
VSLARVENPSNRFIFGALGALAYILLLAGLDRLTRGAVGLPALVPPFGASVVIVFFTPESPLGRPRNVVLGHVLSGLVASCTLFLLPGAPLALLAGVAVAGSGLAMLATRSVHPPGGATALLAVVSERKLGFSMLLCPALLGAVALCSMRLVLDSALQWWSARASAPRQEADAAGLPEVRGP